MQEWNVVINLNERGFRQAYKKLGVFESIEKTGTPGHITFEDPDAIIAVETIAQWAGLSLWRREDLQRYPFIRLD